LRAGASSTAVALRRRQRAAWARPARRLLLALAVLAVAGAALLWFPFAGTASTVPEGVFIAGVDVGGMRADEARSLLERRAASLAQQPVTFSAGTESWRLTPAQLGVEVDWAAAIDSALEQGSGFGPVRGVRRLRTRFFEVEIAPPVQVYDAALVYHVDRFAEAVAEEPREAAIELRGLEPVLLGARTGRVLHEEAAERTVVRALSSFSRAPVGLPVGVEPPSVTAAELRPALRQVRTALSAPVRLKLDGTRWRLPRWRIAQLLSLPANGRSELAIAGPRAERWLDQLGARVETATTDARFESDDQGVVHVVPGRAGVDLDPVATARNLLAAAVSPGDRTGEVVVQEAQPELTTAEAQGLGITSVLSSYSTPYSGSADRINNLQLAVRLLDGALVAPGATFSLNDRVGERTEERGFRVAPVIIGGEYEEEVGGGVSQVATTVFNAAWEAGLKIVERNPHALYIARYQLGRDATVNYPNLDLKFRNDTDRSIYVRAGAGGSGIFVSLYGAPTGRRVVSEAGPLRVTGPPPVERVKDAQLFKGQTAVEAEGQPSRAVTVTRTVYAEDGSVLYDETWSTRYLGEKRIVRVGTKPKPKPKPEEKTPPPTVTTTTTTTPTTTTTTTTTPG
jgi:vancomycin resistance protein YoaR